MSELSPKARALLEAARRNHGPNDEDRARVLSHLHASLGIAAALPVLVETSSAQASVSGPQLVPSASVPPAPPVMPDVLLQPAASKALGWSKLLAWKAGKIYLASLVIGGSAVGVSMLPRGDAAELAARRSTAVVAPVEHPEPARLEAQPVAEEADVVEPVVAAAPSPVELAAVEPAAQQPAPEAATLAPPVHPAEAAKASRTRVRHSLHANHLGRGARHARRVRARDRESLAQAAVARTSLERSALTAGAPQAEPKPWVPSEDAAAAIGVGGPSSPELSLIRAALTSLRDRDPEQALRLLDEHAARYPNGAFGMERRGLHAVALCAAGRTEEGAQERARFLKKAGDSPIAARVRSACPR